MATAAADFIIIDAISVAVLPDLSSNLMFIDGHEVADDMQKNTMRYLEGIGYKVKPGQQMIHTGGTGVLPGLFDLMQMAWEHKSLITIPITIIKTAHSYFKSRNIRRLQSIQGSFTINLYYESDKPLPPKASFVEKKQALSSLLTAARASQKELQSKYPSVNFNIEIEISLKHYSADLRFALPCSKTGSYMRSYQIMRMFDSVSIAPHTNIHITFAKFGLIKRTDSQSEKQIESNFYFIVPGKILFKDFHRITGN